LHHIDKYDNFVENLAEETLNALLIMPKTTIHYAALFIHRRKVSHRCEALISMVTTS